MNMKKTVLITGCSSGFGKTSAIHFLEHGWNVIATMRSPQPWLFEKQDQLLIVPLDVTNPQSISNAISKGIERFEKIDVIVNNAGIGMFGAHEAVTDATTRKVFETNTFGVMGVSRAIIPHMREHGSGTIINVTSSVGIAPMPLVAVYTASKYAIEGFSESLSYELEMLGIQVKIVQPGLAPSTSFAANSEASYENTIPPAYADYSAAYFKSMQEYPAAYTSAEDVAKVIYTAATDDCNKLRYPAGADSVMLAELRQSLSEQEFMTHIQTMCGGNTVNKKQ